MEPLRLLVLYQARDAARDHPGYYDGFERLVAEGDLQAHHAISFRGVAEERGWAALWDEACAAAAEMEADAVFLQFFHGRIPDPTGGIQRLKGVASKPVIFTSLGDGFGRWTKKTPKHYHIASRLADVNFLTGMGYLARQVARHGGRNLVLMPHGCCQVRFGEAPDRSMDTPEFHVVFIGSRIASRNPIGHFFWAGRERQRFVALFTRRYGRRFGLFGHGWDGNPSWQGPIRFDRQHSAHHRASVVVGGAPYCFHDYYTSDRVFISLASGIPFVDYWVTGVDAIFKPGQDWWLARDAQEMIDCCDQLLSLSPEERTALGSRARERVLAAHTQYQRCRQMMTIIRDVRGARLHGRPAAEPRLPFLREASDPRTAAAIVNWQG